MICSVILTFLRKLFIPGVVAVIFLLVAFTMMPSILWMLSGDSGEMSAVKNLGVG